MVVTIDLGEANDLHPQNKKDIGERMALAAQEVVLGEPVLAQGPVCESMTVTGGVATITFSHMGRGLKARGGPLRGFELCGGDGEFHLAQAELKGEAILVRSHEVPKPSAVRYAWDDNPSQANLYSAEGLPASPFVICLDVLYRSVS